MRLAKVKEVFRRGERWLSAGEIRDRQLQGEREIRADLKIYIYRVLYIEMKKSVSN